MSVVVLLVLVLGVGMVLGLYAWWTVRRRMPPARIPPDPQHDRIILELRAHQVQLKQATEKVRAGSERFMPTDAERVERLQMEADVQARRHP